MEGVFSATDMRSQAHARGLTDALQKSHNEANDLKEQNKALKEQNKALMGKIDDLHARLDQ